jgi:hypothetical protein
MGASENAIEGVSAARKVHGILCAAAVLSPMLRPISLLAFAVLTVAACTSLDETFGVTPFLREQITGDTWRACLAREYQIQTRLAVRQGRDWAEASRFSAKGWSALASEPVSPWQTSMFELTAGRKARLEQAERELGAALIRKDSSPCHCGKAQAAFDGWLAASARIGADEGAAEKNFAGAVTACREGTP